MNSDSEWNIAGKTALITGGNAGVGRATALELSRREAYVVLLCRDRTRGETAAREISAETGNAVELVTADLSIQQSIRDAAAEIRERFPQLHVLINNAAIITEDRQLTRDGYERQWAVNALAPMLLTHELRKTLLHSAPARVISVSSGMHLRTGWDESNLQGERRYHPRTVYAGTKLANVLFTVELARVWQATGVTVNALHPGTIATGLYRTFLGLPRWLGFVSRVWGADTNTGAASPVFLASDPGVSDITGKYFARCRPACRNPLADDDVLRGRFWEQSCKQVGIAPDDWF